MRALIAASLLLLALPLRAETTLPGAMPGQSVGSASCASSTCHGAVSPSSRSDILHNEYSSWQQQDPHAGAFRTLQSPAGQRIAEKLALPTPAEHTAECLACHSHNVPAEQRADSFRLDEGVGCESCHGPAGGWRDSHSATGASHGSNIAHGLYPTDKPVAQAALCTSCHVGNSDQSANHRLMAAGHPRLAFELATFNALRGYHQRFDDDWQTRKGQYNTLQHWAIGQVTSARQLLLRQADDHSSGLFPELSLYDCHGCHRPATATAAGPQNSGVLRANDSYLRMALTVARVLAPAQHEALADSYHAWLSASQASREALRQSAAALASQLAALADTLANTTPDEQRARALLAALLAPATPYTDYSDAEQAYMAIASVIAWQREQQDSNASTSTQDRALSALRATLADEDRFSPAAFAKALAALAQP